METFESADAILDFAISREEESYEFYMNLAEKMGKPHISDMFTKIAREELGHKEKLKKVKEGKLLVSSPGKILDLKIADYLVDKEPSPDMDYQEALILAMKKEKAAFKLYITLSEKTGDDNLENLFLTLAQEEAKHKLRFEIEYDDHVLKDN